METNSADVINQLYESPETSIHHIDLVYVDDSKLTISREGVKDNFKYNFKGKPLQDVLILERIESLVIPHAWQKVRITHLENGHLQATGRDGKRRKQYRYHETWSKIRNQTKFYRLEAFGKKLSKIREHVDEKLKDTIWSRDKVISLIIKLMDETHIRIGSEAYAKQNNTYGLVTMRKKHLVQDENKLRFEFVGKRGKKHRVTIRNKKLKRLVRQCEEIPGWELFQFFDAEGKKQSVESGMVNDFLYRLSGEHFTAKDFRTWSATVIFYEYLRDGDIQEESLDKRILRAYDAAAAALGNTRNVCKKYYVHPEVVNQSKQGFKKLRSGYSKKVYENHDYLTDPEKEVLYLIKDFQPKLN